MSRLRCSLLWMSDVREAESGVGVIGRRTTRPLMLSQMHSRVGSMYRGCDFRSDTLQRLPCSSTASFLISQTSSCRPPSAQSLTVMASQAFFMSSLAGTRSKTAILCPKKILLAHKKHHHVTSTALAVTVPTLRARVTSSALNACASKSRMNSRPSSRPSSKRYLSTTQKQNCGAKSGA